MGMIEGFNPVNIRTVYALNYVQSYTLGIWMFEWRALSNWRCKNNLAKTLQLCNKYLEEKNIYMKFRLFLHKLDHVNFTKSHVLFVLVTNT